MALNSSVAAPRYVTHPGAAPAKLSRLFELPRHRQKQILDVVDALFDDLAHYDMIFNPDRVSVEEGSRMIAQLVSRPDFRENEARKLVELRRQVLGLA